MKVIDIASYQGVPDFHAVKASGVEGVIVKCTESTNYVNPFYHKQVDGARAAGLHVGHYHFARPGTGNSPSTEFNFFQAHADARPADWIVLDAESAGGSSAWVNEWLTRAGASFNRRPILYSYGPWLRAHLDPHTEIRGDLWIAGYSATPPAVPAPFKAWQAWQFTSSANVPGITGRVDMSDWHIPPHAGPAPQPTPPTPIGVTPPVSTYIFQLKDHPHTFVSDGKTSRWHRDANDHNTTVWHIAANKGDATVYTEELAEAKAKPLYGDIDPALTALGFTSAVAPAPAAGPPAVVDVAAIAKAVADLLAGRLAA